jgi:hypothetical protein
MQRACGRLQGACAALVPGVWPTRCLAWQPLHPAGDPKAIDDVTEQVHLMVEPIEEAEVSPFDPGAAAAWRSLKAGGCICVSPFDPGAAAAWRSLKAGGCICVLRDHCTPGMRVCVHVGGGSLAGCVRGGGGGPG